MAIAGNLQDLPMERVMIFNIVAEWDKVFNPKGAVDVDVPEDDGDADAAQLSPGSMVVTLSIPLPAIKKTSKSRYINMPPRCLDLQELSSRGGAISGQSHRFLLNNCVWSQDKKM